MNREVPVLERARDLLVRAGYELIQIEPAGRGSQHHLFVVEVDDGPLRLLRMPRAAFIPRLQPVLLAEAEAILRARNLVPVPHPVELLPHVGHPEASLEPILPGTRASDLRDKSASSVDLSRICLELGRCLANLHRITREDSDLTLIRSLDIEPDEKSRCLLHGDAHLGNLLVEAHPKKGWVITGMIDWSFCAWGPPEADLVEMAICEAEPRPHLGRVFYEAYVDAGGLPPREPVFRQVLIQELDRRLREHSQANEFGARDRWTHWLDGLQRPGALATRVFDVGREAGHGLV